MMKEVVLGIDLGTQGARVMAVRINGEVVASASEPMRGTAADLPAGWAEQDPVEWWRVVCDCIRQVVSRLPEGTRVAGVCVDSTSGTILPVDVQGEPLCPAILYNDQRSELQALKVQSAGVDLQQRFGYQFGSSFGLPKMLWLKEERPELFERTRWLLHAADFITGKLTGEFGFSDTSNALKSGFDLSELCWPDFIEQELGIPGDRLPQIVLPGQPVGMVCQRAAEETLLATDTLVLAGATDGTAAQFSSGATQPGEWNSTLGTTLVFKGISRALRPDPLGRIYFHRHPEGWWMPGGASNTGTDWIAHDHPGEDIPALDEQTEGLIPSGLVRYPLLKHGERFPFVHTQAQGFVLPDEGSPIERYAAGIEGIGMLERLAYETLEQVGLEVGRRVYITGGGARSPLWSRVRASVLGKTLVQPAVTETAFGAALLAATGCWYVRVSRAIAAMASITRMIEPEPDWQARYDEKYARFKEELQRRGYV